jgi:hypothetical protein
MRALRQAEHLTQLRLAVARRATKEEEDLLRQVREGTHEYSAALRAVSLAELKNMRERGKKVCVVDSNLDASPFQGTYPQIDTEIAINE